MNNKSYLTAITRSRISVPMRYLDKQNLLSGRVLDYGCGKGFDANKLCLEKYDPHFFPEKPAGKFDVITCNYVLNVVLKQDEESLIEDIKARLKPAGTAYISVRRDVKTDGYTSKGTYQRNVKLNFPVLKETSSYCIYELSV